MNLSEIRLAIKNWDAARKHATLPQEFFNAIAGFEITQKYVKLWKAKQAHSIHAYPGIYNNEYYFILVDNVTDSHPITNDSPLFVVKCLSSYELSKLLNILTSETGNIDPYNAYRRTLAWCLCKDNYLENYLSYTKDELFFAFTIPFSDFNEEKMMSGDSDTATDKKCFATLAMNGNEEDGIYPEVILWDSSMTVTNKTVSDVSLPVPPFGTASTFALYDESVII
jgi:hypothetical protein